MKKVSKVLTATISCLMATTLIMPVNAEGEVEKKESVYTVLNSDGSVNTITVSDTLHSDSGFSNYQDKSDLQNVENLKSSDAVNSSNGNLIWNTSDSDIYYQGTSNKELPLTVKITYTLDGKEITSDELVGKSGHLAIKINVTNSSKQTYTANNKTYNLVTPFVTGLVCMMDDDTFSNVKVNSGTVTSDSSHSLIASVMVPGLKSGLKQVLDTDLMHKLEDYLIDEITIEADVTDYESPTLMMAAATSTDALKEEFDDIDDFSSIFDKLDDLKEATNELIDGTSSLYDGAVKLNDGVATLKDGANTLSSGASSLYDGANKVSAGANTLYAYLNQVSSNSAALNDGIQQVADGILKTVNTSLTAQGFEAITWDNFDTKLKDYMKVTDAEIASAKAQIKEKAGDVDNATVDALIYMAATNTDSSKTFEEKVEQAGAELKEAQKIQNSEDFTTASSIVGQIAQGTFDFNSTNTKVTQVLTAIRTQTAASPSSEQLDKTYSQVFATVKQALSQPSQSQEVDDNAVKKVLAYACDNPLNDKEVLGSENISNAYQKVNGGETSTGAADPRNDEAVISKALKPAYANAVNQTALKDIYDAVIATLKDSAGDNASLVFAYGAVKNETYNAQSDDPYTFFSKYSGDLTKLASAKTNIENSKTEKGQQVIKATLTQIVAQTLNSSLSPVLEQLNSVNTLVVKSKEYTAGVDAIFANCKTLTDGAAQVANGSKQIKDGASSLLSGVGTLKDGSQTLADGAKTLKEGMQKYNDEAISKLTESSRITSLEEASNLLTAMSESEDNYNNYSGISEGTDGSIKFVFKVNGSKKAKSDESSSETTKEKVSFWQRILNLFKF